MPEGGSFHGSRSLSAGSQVHVGQRAHSSPSPLSEHRVLRTASFLSFSVCLKKIKTKPEYEKVRMQRSHSPGDTSLLVTCDFKGRETKGEEGQFASHTAASARQRAAAASQSA